VLTTQTSSKPNTKSVGEEDDARAALQRVGIHRRRNGQLREQQQNRVRSKRTMKRDEHEHERTEELRSSSSAMAVMPRRSGTMTKPTDAVSVARACGCTKPFNATPPTFDRPKRRPIQRRISSSYLSRRPSLPRVGATLNRQS
jgi:hypothetical protein